MKYVSPTLNERSYNCPRCGTLCPQNHFVIWKSKDDKNDTLDLSVSKEKIVTSGQFFRPPSPVSPGKPSPLEWHLVISVCTECEKYTVWENRNVIFPESNTLPTPAEDMPNDICEIYEEATGVYKHSKRASAALLRLAIEHLLINHLDVPKNSINKMIGDLVEKNDLPPYVQQGLDTLRYYGNKGIHFGEIADLDDEEKVTFLFTLINLLIEELITKPKTIEKFYDELPESFREQVTSRDKN
ncbi:DUF4145 domain-containing protein [Halobacillus sp. KGW1]|uniref:DUF4145 domain-containing protein n=1 Tax=Halobacillus sp. KGW1 TaxID=1793726 RepID=UPI0007848037|nr:DUF4145 domain-containing protein [Halobacillus sp. KGW1]